MTVRCTACDNETTQIDEEFLTKFNISLCQNCIQTDKSGTFSLITKTEAQKTYLLTDEELNHNPDLPFIIKPNPKRAQWAKMHLYLRYQVEQFAIKKWGSLEEISAEHDQREELQAQRKKKKFEQDLKNLRKSVAKPKDSKSKSLLSHEHKFIELEIPLLGESGSSVRVKECQICKQQIKFEEL